MVKKLKNMVNINRNNLDKAASPYLQQHKGNPINWQEWDKEILEFARANNKLILVSVGYATCHWCHVMAMESFSDLNIANYLNNHFIAIKVDKEQRPDIDRFMMAFIVEQQGSGGWPLNVILTPDLNPILALTYAYINPLNGMPGFLEILKSAKDIYLSNKNSIKKYSVLPPQLQSIPEHLLIDHILSNFDIINGGFGAGHKFPPHTTLIFLLSYYGSFKDPKVKIMIERTLDKIAISGLHDHLQGGFYRYCVDNEWTIPHFEKMLYDQAMLLWVYSMAFNIFQKKEYKIVAEKIIQCLEESFEADGLFYSAHDADTDHEEGKTYLWDLHELKKILNHDELGLFESTYKITEEGNFEGKIHLIKKQNSFLPDIEQKLLSLRKKRSAPFTDKKINTSWNSLAGIALFNAHRYLGNENAKIKAITLFENILKKHYSNGILTHSSLDNNKQNGEFLEDYASVLLLATYIYEETNNHIDIIEKLFKKLIEFNDSNWKENKTEDFIEIAAETFDHPTPSSTSMAELASFRVRIILGLPYGSGEYKQPLYFDFFNYMFFQKNGHLHVLHVINKLQWKDLPINVMQIQSNKIQECYMNNCMEFSSEEKLILHLSKVQR